MYVTFKIALNTQVNVSNKPCLYLFAFWHRFILELYLLCMLPNDTYVILSICTAVVDYTCIKYVRELRKFIRLK